MNVSFLALKSNLQQLEYCFRAIQMSKIVVLIHFFKVYLF